MQRRPCSQQRRVTGCSRRCPRTAAPIDRPRRRASVFARTGILPSQAIRAMIAGGEIMAAPDIEANQIQPASLDLRLGKVAYRIRASFLPGPNATVRDKLAELKFHEIDLTKGAVLEAGCVYLVPLIEQLKLRSTIAGFANPKSSTGRLDVFTRLIADRQDGFDSGRGRLFGPALRRDLPAHLLHQGALRLAAQSDQVPPPRRPAARRRRAARPGRRPAPCARFIPTSAWSRAMPRSAKDSICASASRRSRRRPRRLSRAPLSPAWSMSTRSAPTTSSSIWEAVHLGEDRRLVLDPHEFYILASKESVSVPPAYVAEMAPFDPLIGEYRVHYAGFFDPGFGYAEGKAPGAKAVLEVRSLDIPFILEDGQIVGRLVYDKLTDIPDTDLRPGHRLALPGARPEAVQALQAGTSASSAEQLPPPSTQNLAQSDGRA